MPIIRIRDVGGGVNKDLSVHELPENAWTDANNIRFLDGSAHQTYGHTAVYGTPTEVPTHVFPISVGGARYWIYLSNASIFCVNGTTHTEISRSAGGAYAGTANSWTSAVIGGIPVMCDGSTTNLPQAWGLVLATPCTDLTAWPASTYCKAIRSYKNYLVGLNITKTTTNYPFMVKWSHPADPGALPVTWDHTDATKDAGEADLAEGQDAIVDGLQLRDSFMIYKESSIWRMDYVGGAYVHRFTKVLGQSGALARNCIAEIDGRHFVLAGSDVIIHDGNSATSVLDRAARRWLFNNIDQTNYKASFVFKNPYMNEVYACFPSVGSTIPDTALVYNYSTGTVGIRDIPSINHANNGLVESGLGPTTWADDHDSWGSDVTTWGQSDFTPDAARVLMGSSAQKIYLLDSSTKFDATAVDAFLERRGLSLGSPETIKLVTGVKPRIHGEIGETVLISVGSSNEPYEDPTYSTPVAFTIGTTVQCDFTVSGRYIAIKFETGTTSRWSLDSYDLTVENVGQW